MDDIRARGWLLARLELAIATFAVLLGPIMWLTAPTFVGGPPEGVVQPVVETLIAEVLAIVGLVWMVRIWRGPTRDTPPEWRYRE